MKKFFIIFIFSSSLLANQELNTALDKISLNMDCKISLIKKTDSVVLQTQSITPSTLHITKNKFRFETHTENKNIIIYDSRWYWILEYEADQITQISRTKNKYINFNDLLDSKKLKQNFILSKSIKENSVIIDLSPKKKNFAFKKATILIKKNSLQEIQYQDDLDNKTTLTINSISCESKIDKQKYQFVSQKNQTILDF